jgi:tRNA(Ile2) C34 agmatinyltransferase TiaS
MGVAVLFRCPVTGLRVQGWATEEVPSDATDIYVSVQCPACARTHLVNPATEKVLGTDDKPSD